MAHSISIELAYSRRDLELVQQQRTLVQSRRSRAGRVEGSQIAGKKQIPHSILR